MECELKTKFLINKSRSALINGVSKSHVIDKIKPEFKDLGSMNISDIGRYGERSYYNYLNSILDHRVSSITWVNKEEEKGLPYDFIVSIDSEEFYIDVKSTRGSLYSAIYISNSELSFSKTVDNYLIARLYDIGSSRGKYKAGDFNVSTCKIESLTIRN